jgi:HEAT repeats
MARIMWSLGPWLGVTLAAVALAAAAPRQPPGLFIQMDAGFLTVKAQAIPQGRLLEAIAQALHVELIMAGPLAERKSLDLERRPWEEVLKTALAPASWAGLYTSTAGTSRLTKLVVFPPQGDQPPTVPSPSAAEHPPEVQATIPPRGELGLRASLTELLAADNDETRAVAVVALVNLGGAQAVAAVTSALQDEDPWVRQVAVEALAVIGGEPAIQGLQQALQDDHPDVQQAAQEALARLQQEDE